MKKIVFSLLMINLLLAPLFAVGGNKIISASLSSSITEVNQGAFFFLDDYATVSLISYDTFDDHPSLTHADIFSEQLDDNGIPIGPRYRNGLFVVVNYLFLARAKGEASSFSFVRGVLP